MKKLSLFFALFFSLTVLSLHAQQPAFPGAEGFGAYATGGRGGQVVHVTNLNASGSGSLADAVSQPNRIVVFDVGGVINITNASITIKSNITIAGQTAPGEGITIYGGRVIASKSSNIIIRYLRMRGGKSIDSSKCTLTLDECQNVILDHCSISWGPWDDVHIKDANNITWQHCIISEGIEPQRFGSITDGTRNWTVHHCLWANNKSRNPKMKCYIQYYNNVVYNYSMGIIGGHSAADNYQDVMNNYFIAGPSTTGDKYFDDWTNTDHLYSTGNYYDGNKDGTLDGRLITDYHQATPMQQPYFQSSKSVHLETAAQAYATVADQCGASRVRDSHDLRIIGHLTSLGTRGAFIASEDDLGGIGTLTGGAAPQDTDRDGMPDDWERANGLNPNANDAAAYTLGGGYTNIEHYVNSLAAKSNYIICPQAVTAKATASTKARITWTNMQEDATAIVIEQSEDGVSFVEIKRVAPKTTSLTVTGLTAKKVYYFRLKTITPEGESDYSPVVAINDEFMRPGGGTPAGTRTFSPVAGKLYRIINYATIPFNSGTTLGGSPKYLCCNANGSLGTTDNYTWNDHALMWEITAVEGGYQIRNFGTGLYFTANNVSVGSGDARIGTTATPSVFTITYTADQSPAQSGLSTAVSMYRINSPAASNYQIRARGFADDWFWGSGTLDRADMIFTFSDVDRGLVDAISHSAADITTRPTTIYNLQGQPLSKPQKGINIINGKKVLLAK